MKRSFRVEEIMLDAVAGEVRGTFQWDPQSELPDRVCGDAFTFRRTDNHVPVTLSASQRAAALEVVERTLADTDLGATGGHVVASAQRYSPAAVTAPSTATLAEYLRSPRQHAAARALQRRDQRKAGS